MIYILIAICGVIGFLIGWYVALEWYKEQG